MNKQMDFPGETQVATAFTAQASYFDKLYGDDPIIAYKRKRVREVLDNSLGQNSLILELNAGTGEDAIFLANRGHRVHGTDISEGMQEELKKKVSLNQLNELVSQELCSFNNLEKLMNKGPFDCIFSNFAGLNCAGNLAHVLLSFDVLLKPGAIVVLVMLPPFCLWEFLLLLKGKFKTATRRLFSRNGRTAKIDNNYFTCWYYSPGYIRHIMKKKYEYLGTEGLCTIVAPSYLKGFAEKHPAIFSFLVKQEDKLKKGWPWRNIGDYYIISFRKN